MKEHTGHLVVTFLKLIFSICWQVFLLVFTAVLKVVSVITGKMAELIEHLNKK